MDIHFVFYWHFVTLDQRNLAKFDPAVVRVWGCDAICFVLDKVCDSGCSWQIEMRDYGFILISNNIGSWRYIVKWLKGNNFFLLILILLMNVLICFSFFRHILLIRIINVYLLSILRKLYLTWQSLALDCNNLPAWLSTQNFWAFLLRIFWVIAQEVLQSYMLETLFRMVEGFYFEGLLHKLLRTDRLCWLWLLYVVCALQLF